MNTTTATTTTTDMRREVVSRDQWLAARIALLAKEKALTRQRDAVTGQLTQLREMLSVLAGLGNLPGTAEKTVEEAAEKAEEIQEAVEDVVEQAVEAGEATAAAEAANGSSSSKVG